VVHKINWGKFLTEEEEMKKGLGRLLITMSIIFALAVGGVIGHSIGISSYVPVIEKLEAKVVATEREKEKEAELTFVRLDLQEYQHLSPEIRERMLAALDSASRKYRIPVGFLHAILRIESNYQFQIDHPKVTIKIKGKPVTTCARGLGGVMWDIWADSLKANGICNAVSDLYVPENSIMASAYILRYETDRTLSRSKNVSAYNIIREIIKSYYGAYSAPYEARMMQVTNELWLKRIAKDLITG